MGMYSIHEQHQITDGVVSAMHIVQRAPKVQCDCNILRLPSFPSHRIKSQNAQSSLNYKTLGHAIDTKAHPITIKLCGLYSDFIFAGSSGREMRQCALHRAAAVLA